MEGCPHVRQVQLASDKSFLNPRNWACCECGTTDSVWACLLCSHVACGRTCSGHALKHFEQTKHPMAVEVNQRYIHCYLCDDYVLNDNTGGDINLVQSLLSQVASQHYQESCTRSGRVIKPAATFMRAESKVEEANSNAADQRYTALCHWRYLLLSRAFNTWRVWVALSKQERDSTGSLPPPPLPPLKRKKRLLTPGMTGLRNLGNTCYMNAVLQSLGDCGPAKWTHCVESPGSVHLVFFRECFRQLLPQTPLGERGRKDVVYNRQSTIECFQHISTRPASRPGLMRQVKMGGLSGGAERREKRQRRQSSNMMNVQQEEDTPLSLCHEMHRLMRVMWSGKWAVVTPHTVLNSVWRLIPTFHGYTQQDAQEFLCELLDRLQTELQQWSSTHAIPLSTPFREVAIPHEVLPSLFQGTLTSELRYCGCGHCSRVDEPFWDLSLDFPELYQEDTKNHAQATTPSRQCTLKELLDKFTKTELLDGEIYRCDTCSTGGAVNGTSLQSANKRLLIAVPPDVLRLHLKRFRWCGRIRHKINTHVCFPLTVDLQPYCSLPSTQELGVVHFAVEPCDFVYDLSSVIIHHGTGFSSGHYTCYCWNSEADSWVHCNDTRICRCPLDEVLRSQAYILFYVRRRGQSGGVREEERPPIKRRKIG